MDLEEDMVEEDDEITQEDAWTVISTYFEENGLVFQQLDSFNEFVHNTIQEIVDESGDIEIRPKSPHNPGHLPDFAEVGVRSISLLAVDILCGLEECRFVRVFYWLLLGDDCFFSEHLKCYGIFKLVCLTDCNNSG